MPSCISTSAALLFGHASKTTLTQATLKCPGFTKCALHAAPRSCSCAAHIALTVDIERLPVQFHSGTCVLCIERVLNGDDGSELDVMVVWTDFSECSQSGLGAGCTLSTTTYDNMVALIELAVVETNTACKQSFLQACLHYYYPPPAHTHTHTHNARAPPSGELLVVP